MSIYSAGSLRLSVQAGLLHKHRKTEGVEIPGGICGGVLYPEFVSS